MQLDFDINALKTPCYVVDERLLVKNLELLESVAHRTGCRILLAQKAFSMFAFYPLIARYLQGTAASSLFEARLGFEEMGKENHIFSAAYTESEFDEIVLICDHIVFNSFGQWQKFKSKAAKLSCGIRVNPECSTQDHAVYDPCAPFSRLGVTAQNFRPDQIDGIKGLHFHTLCEQNANDLACTLLAFEDKFGPYISRMEWVNFGGGHHITRADYDIQSLVRSILRFKAKYGVEVYLEPGEAVALNTGYLVSTVLDIVDNGMPIAILDTSAACHMPDVLEMPYRPPVTGAAGPGEKPHTFRLAGPTCLAGDVIGDYSFDTPLQIGDKVVFGDMAHYTMVKNNTFNGFNLPDIAKVDARGDVQVVRTFQYRDFKERLG